MLVAISNSKCIGYKLYESGGMTKERLVDFFEEFIFPHYKDHLIILDNAGSHNNQYVKDAILESRNKYQFSVPYTPKTNCIELFFNQIKHYLKLNRRVLKFKELEKEVKNAITRIVPCREQPSLGSSILKKVKKINYKNYFEYTYGKKMDYKPRGKSTLHRKPKIYKE